MPVFFASKKLAFNYIYEYLKKNSGNLIISGGKSIKGLLNSKIKYLNLNDRKILLSDERLVKKNSNLRNDKVFYNLIKKKIIKKKNFFNYEKEYYDEKYIKNFSTRIKKINFKIAIMGLGSNGHIASIFNDTYKSSKIFYNVTKSPKRPKNRVTVSINKIKKTHKIFLLANKKTKKKEIKNFNKNNIIKVLKKNIELIVFS
jgi:6-phosphogluconolactonase/glucosamine-6-phosphate isomerase/deaminase